MNRWWTEEKDSILREMYKDYERKEIAVRLGTTVGAVRSRCSRLGLNTKKEPSWTLKEKEKLRSLIQEHNGEFYNITDIARIMGRFENSISIKVSRYGFGDRYRVVPGGRKDYRKFKGDAEALKAHLSEVRKTMWVTHEHPRGFLGHHHTDGAKKIISAKSVFMNLRRSQEDRKEINQKRNETNMKRYGTYAPGLKLSNPYSRARGGKREDLGNVYFRSSWEANYARYLNFLIAQGNVIKWEFEPETFYFEGVKRGCLSYTPDFKITEADGSVVYHEVKGWMDTKSKTKLKRMSKYHPNIKIVIIDAEQYKSISKISALIPNWEKTKWDY